VLLTVITIVLCAVIIAAGVYTVYTKKLITAIISAGVISLLASIIYLILAAPDVAMTEAAIGSGLTTIVFLYALSRVRKAREGEDG